MKKSLCLVLLFTFFQKYSFSQNKYTDSLEEKLKNHNAYKQELGRNVPPMYDTTATFILHQLAYNYATYNFDKALQYALVP